MHLGKCQALLFHSLSKKRFFTAWQIKVLLEAMLHSTNCDIFQQIWIKSLQIQCCYTRIFLKFSFHNGVSKLRFFFSYHQIYAWELLCGSSLAAAKVLMMVAFPLPLCYHMTFIGTFSCLYARIQAFSSSLV